MFYWIIVALVCIFWFVILELGKNTLLGWGLVIAALVFLIIIEIKKTKVEGFWVHFCLCLLLLTVCSSAFVLSMPPYKTVPAVENKNPAVTQTITVNEGKLTGVYNKDESVEVFAGIPYAAPPVGELRWKEPQAPDKWEGVKACDHFAPMSMQKRDSEIMNTLTRMVGYHDFKISLKDNYREAVSEDSLYLNIWKPAGDVKDAPVLFFIHGGSLTSGQPSFSEYRGEDLAKKGIIVVNFGYRLNVFGYMADESLAAESPNGTTGNYGLLDQIAALKWVNENIAAFGGDASKITIAGESAGSSSVNALCVSPLAKGLFRYAIAESSGITPKVPYHTFRSFDDALKSGKETLDEFGVKTAGELRAMSAEELVKTSTNNSAMTVDGYAITEQPYLTYEKGENNEQALLNGYNSHEANVFNLFTKVDEKAYKDALDELFGEYADEAYEAYPPESVPLDYDFLVEAGGAAKGTYDHILGGTWFAYSHKKWSDYMAAQNKPVYFYYFSKDNGSLRANHAGEMPYAYGNLWRHGYLYEDADFALSDTMQNYWVNFVKTGNPNGNDLPQWAPYTKTQRQILQLDNEVKMIDDPYSKLYPIIDKSQEAK
ncbi:MAG: carboxylesterase family protein [Ruminococcaceae bacterium]|nr:carboxylesterase family protein [Oscillospiraceae bacterium]